MMRRALESNFWNPDYVNKLSYWPLSPLSIPNFINNSYFHLQNLSRALLRLLVCLLLALHLLTVVSSFSAYSGCSLESAKVIWCPNWLSMGRSVKFLKTKRQLIIFFCHGWRVPSLRVTRGATHCLPSKTFQDPGTCSLIPKYNRSTLGKAAMEAVMRITSRRARCILDNSSQKILSLNV